jgi:hypothetical protein
MVESQLEVLQAQIEPHFLFNTLAHVKRLYEVRRETGDEMLTSLRNYLRAALPRMREAGSTLEREAELVRAYLNILRIRLGARLEFAFDIAPEARRQALPPMVLITLVENAIKHGIAPRPEGGDDPHPGRRAGRRAAGRGRRHRRRLLGQPRQRRGAREHSRAAEGTARPARFAHAAPQQPVRRRGLRARSCPGDMKAFVALFKSRAPHALILSAAIVGADALRNRQVIDAAPGKPHFAAALEPFLNSSLMLLMIVAIISACQLALRPGWRRVAIQGVTLLVGTLAYAKLVGTSQWLTIQYRGLGFPGGSGAAHVHHVGRMGDVGAAFRVLRRARKGPHRGRGAAAGPPRARAHAAAVARGAPAGARGAGRAAHALRCPVARAAPVRRGCRGARIASSTT